MQKPWNANHVHFIAIIVQVEMNILALNGNKFLFCNVKSSNGYYIYEGQCMKNCPTHYCKFFNSIQLFNFLTLSR